MNCLTDVASCKVEATQLEHLAEALQEWDAHLRVRYREARVAVVSEQARGPVSYALMTTIFSFSIRSVPNRSPITGRPFSQPSQKRPCDANVAGDGPQASGALSPLVA